MVRFNYSTATPMGQMVAEGVNELQNGSFKITRAALSVKLMSDQQLEAELGVQSANQADFRTALEQLKAALETAPFINILPNLDQG